MSIDSSVPAYTLALCTHNHIDRLRHTLADINTMRQPERPWEFLVVDNGCTDGTSEYLASDQWPRPTGITRIVREDKLGLSHARNRAITEAAGEYIIFIDDDESPDINWLYEYEQCIEREHPDALGGAIDVRFVNGDRPDWLQDELLGFLGKLSHGPEPMILTSPKTAIFGGNFGFRKSIFQTIGDFSTDLGRRGTENIGGEDTEIYRRILEHDLKVCWVPDAIIWHRIESTKLHRGYFLDLHFRQGRSEGQRKRGTASRIPPRYLYPQLLRAYMRAIGQRFRKGSRFSLRLEMNAAYFTGYLLGWMQDNT